MRRRDGLKLWQTNILWLFLFIYCVSLNPILIVVKADPIIHLDCPTLFNGSRYPVYTYAPRSTYQKNLNTLLSILSSNANVSSGFFNYSVGSSPPDVAYGLFLCRGDVSATMCRHCIINITRDMVRECPDSKLATIWLEMCMFSYSNESTVFTKDGPWESGFWGGVSDTVLNVTGTHFHDALVQVMDDVSNRASIDHSGKKFATAKASYASHNSVYGLAQCLPYMSDSDCSACLLSSIGVFLYSSEARQGANIMLHRCYVRYETYLFYNASFAAAPPPPSLVQAPSANRTDVAEDSGNGGVSSRVITAIVVPIGIAILLFISGFCFLTRRAKKKYNCNKENNDGDDISIGQSLQYDLSTIQAATNDFSDDKKIGEGGFGPVYKGLLPDGQEVAVKRLSRTSPQGAQEFKTEVALVAKLHHRNLVQLRGFCLEGEEKILIYEFVPNKSLDYFLFDPQEQAKLDWTSRFKIIEGVARAMLYLHEDSRLRVIHRDLKASNILLDCDMNAKVSDFGTARIFGVDQTHGSTSRVVGTVGYMAPEYAMYGQFSAKSDVFSFGVLVLEIISGKKNNNSYQSNDDSDLLSHSWELWKKGKPLDLMDPTLEGSQYSGDEVTRCIYIALMCLQTNPDARPSMAVVVQTLSNYSSMPTVTRRPGFLGWYDTGSNIFIEQGTNHQSTQYSINEASISELEPR